MPIEALNWALFATDSAVSVDSASRPLLFTARNLCVGGGGMGGAMEQSNSIAHSATGANFTNWNLTF